MSLTVKSELSCIHAYSSTNKIGPDYEGQKSSLNLNVHLRVSVASGSALDSSRSCFSSYQVVSPEQMMLEIKGLRTKGCFTNYILHVFTGSCFQHTCCVCVASHLVQATDRSVCVCVFAGCGGSLSSCTCSVSAGGSLWKRCECSSSSSSSGCG